MTHEIVQSDVDLARKLLAAKYPPSDILMALTRRGVGLDAATQLVEDLRQGKLVNYPMTLLPKKSEGPVRAISTVAAQRTAREIEATQPQYSSPAPRQPRIEEYKPSDEEPSIEEPSAPSRLKLWLIVVLVLVVAGAAFVAFKLFAPSKVSARQPEAPVARKQAGLTVAVNARGLQLGDALLTRDSALQTLCRALGAPSRTNHVENSTQLIYAYDRHGLLLYSQPDGGDDQLVLDFDGEGGRTSTLSAFSGTFKIADQIIRPDVDPQSLTNKKSLGLTNTLSAARVLSGRYNDLGYFLAYLKSPQRMSLAGIDLK